MILPQELLILIMSFLSTKDKINCIRVCKNWYQVISGSNLYSELELGNSEFYNLQSALKLFETKRYIGSNVIKLSIKDFYEADMNLLMSLPVLFPKVRSLNLTDIYMFHEQIGPEELDCIDAIKNWNRLEYLVDHSDSFLLSKYILKYCVLHNLKQLEVSLYHDQDEPGSKRDLKILLDNIHHAPALEQITLIEPTIRLDDLELLHNNAQNLKELTLTDIDFSAQQEKYIIVSNPASKLEKFSLKLVSDVDAVENCIYKWFSYIGQKYKNLQVIQIKTSTIGENLRILSEPSEQPEQSEQAVMNMIWDMKCIRSYAMDLYPLTDRIMNIMERNKIKLNNLRLRLKDISDNVQMFDVMKKSSLKEHIDTLAIRISVFPTGQLADLSYVGHGLRELPKIFIHLVHLDIKRIPPIGTTKLLIHIIQSLPVLEILSVGCTDFGMDERDAISSNHRSKECKLKSIHMNLFTIDTRINENIFNEVFRVILRSCPRLERFKLSGRVGFASDAEVNLYFNNNFQLKQVKVYLSGCGSYTVNGKIIKSRLNDENTIARKYYRFKLMIPKENVKVVVSFMCR